MVRPAALKLASLLGVVGGNTTDQREPADRSAEREHAADGQSGRPMAQLIMPGGRYSLCRTRAERFRVAAPPGSTAINATAASQPAAMTDSTASGTAVTGVMPS